MSDACGQNQIYECVTFPWRMGAVQTPYLHICSHMMNKGQGRICLESGVLTVQSRESSKWRIRGANQEIQMLKLSAGKKRSRENVTSNCYLCSKTWSPIRESKQAVSFGSRWSDLRLLCVPKHHLYFWEHWYHIPISKGNLCGFLLVPIAAVPESYSQPLHLHHIPDACHAPLTICRALLFLWPHLSHCII